MHLCKYHHSIACPAPILTSTFSYVIGIYSFKLSLLLSYLRFLPGGYRIATIILAVIITMAHIAFICVFLFLCTPVGNSIMLRRQIGSLTRPADCKAMGSEHHLGSLCSRASILSQFLRLDNRLRRFCVS